MSMMGLVRSTSTPPRLRLVMAGFAALFVAVSVKAAWLTLGFEGEQRKAVVHKQHIPRPDITDRNGMMLAGDMPLASIFAEPYRMIDPDAAALKLMTVLPDLDISKLRRRSPTSGSSSRG